MCLKFLYVALTVLRMGRVEHIGTDVIKGIFAWLTNAEIF